MPNASDTGYAAGAVTLVTMLIAHRIITRLRYFPSIAQLVDHSPRLLVVHGRVLDRELRRTGLTQTDLYGLLRQHGIEDLSEVQFVIFEQLGEVSSVRHTERDGADSALVRDIVAQASSQP